MFLVWSLLERGGEWPVALSLALDHLLWCSVRIQWFREGKYGESVTDNPNLSLGALALASFSTLRNHHEDCAVFSVDRFAQVVGTWSPQP